MFAVLQRCIFVEETPSRETNDQDIEEIIERQTFIENSDDNDESLLVIAAENNITNGSHLSLFYRDAFIGNKAV